MKEPITISPEVDSIRTEDPSEIEIPLPPLPAAEDKVWKSIYGPE